MLTVRDLSCTVSGETVLDSVSFSLSDGEILALIGPSGSGKTALLSSLAGQLPFSGSALTDSAASCGRRKNFLFYPSRQDMREEEDVFQTVLSGRAPHKRFLSSYTAFDIQTAEEMISWFALQDVRNKSLGGLPDSLYKMAVLAHHAAYGAPVLLLDNPEDGLDICARMRLVRALRKYVFEGKRSVIFATNDLNFASQAADRFLALKAGKAAAYGGMDVITEELIREVFGCEGIVSKNVYNGRPEVTLIPET